MAEEIGTPLPPPPPPEGKKNTTLIIIVVAVILLCCFCVGLGVLGWVFGDQILRALGLAFAPALAILA